MEYIIDAILVWSTDIKQQGERLHTILNRIQSSSLKLNTKKCKQRMTELAYVGYLTDKGLELDLEKVKDV